MKQFKTGNLGKTIVIEFERGEKLIEGICAALEKEGVQNATVVSAVGSIQRLKYHRPLGAGAVAEDEFLDIELPMEIGSLSGSVIGGVAHFHFVAAFKDQVHCGHLEPGTEVMFLMEVIMAEIMDCNLERKLTPENVKKLFEKN